MHACSLISYWTMQRYVLSQVAKLTHSSFAKGDIKERQNPHPPFACAPQHASLLLVIGIGIVIGFCLCLSRIMSLPLALERWQRGEKRYLTSQAKAI